MGRMTKVSSGADPDDALRAEREQIDRLLARLRRATGRGARGFSLRTAQATLAKRYDRFTASGDVAADRATLAEFEQQATSLLRKATEQPRDAGSRRTPSAATVTLGKR
jgi:hypothetical protein